MKNKKIAILLLMVLVFTSVMFVIPNKVNATVDSNYSKITYKVPIHNWQRGPSSDNIDDYDLVYYIGDSTWSMSRYTKTAYLYGPVNGTDTKIEIPFSSRVEDSWSGLYCIYFDSTTYNFDIGSTVYLLEEYDFTGKDFSDLGIGNDISAFTINSSDHLSFDCGLTAVDDWETVGSTDACSIDVYMDRIYSSNDVTDPNRTTIEYFYTYDDQSTKTNVIEDNDSITMAEIRYKVDLSVSGNGVTSGGQYSVQVSDLGVNETYSGTTVSAGPVRVDGKSFSGLYYIFHDLPTVNIDYVDSEGNELPEGDMTFEYDGNDDGYYEGWDDAEVTTTYGVTNGIPWGQLNIRQVGTYNLSVPNGIFYNVVPFILAAGLAIVGVIVLKKNSIK